MNVETQAAPILRAAFPEVDSDDPVSYYSQVGDVFQGLSYAWLFWPRLVLLHGAVFLALEGHDEEDISDRLKTPFADGHPDWPRLTWPEAVNSYNRFEVDQLFSHWREPGERWAGACVMLGRVLAETWSARLLQQYPERAFSVNTVETEAPAELWLEVRQVSPDLATPPSWNERRRFLEM